MFEDLAGAVEAAAGGGAGPEDLGGPAGGRGEQQVHPDAGHAGPDPHVVVDHVVVWGNAGATYGSWSYTMGTRDGGHLLAIHVNGDWSGLSVFDDVLSAEFCPEQ
ncbi:hypothetical protein [Micromonospora echinaurantiaca]|uniref:hypothetical protein n=1 Tax=Micromonospora echinaurantiaca TaxID=47857 RepID=UPI0034370BA2